MAPGAATLPIVELTKVLGTENPADILTKYVDNASMEKALKEWNLVFKEGRSPMAPAIMGTSKNDALEASKK